MKKLFFMAAAALAVTLSSCGGSKQVANNGGGYYPNQYPVQPVQQPAQPNGGNPFVGGAYEAPCQVLDTKDHFAATGIYRGSSMQMGELQKYAQRNAISIIREKFHHSYKGMVSEYSSSIGNNRGNDIANKIESAGDQIIDIMLNDAYASCVKYSSVFDDGTVQCYVAIEIPKGEIAEKVSKKVADVLTEDEKEKINFNEYNYRKQMEERMKNYKEEKQ